MLIYMPRLLCHTKATGSGGCLVFFSISLLCFLLGSDGAGLGASREGGCAFCLTDFLLLRLTRPGSAPHLTLLAPNQQRLPQEKSPLCPCREITAGPISNVWGQGGAARDAKSLSQRVHPPDRAGKKVELDKWCVRGMR